MEIITMIEKANKDFYNRQEMLDDFLKTLSDPVHKRIIGAYSDDNSVDAMEKELTKILKEIVKRED